MKRYLIVGLVVGLVAGYLIFDFTKINATNTDSGEDVAGDDATTEVFDFEFAAAPDFEVTSISGERIGLDDLKGNVILLNFWATWCGPCLEEMPMLVALQDDLGAEGLKTIGISVDESGAAVVQEFVDNYDFNYPIIHDTGVLAQQYGGQYAVPTTIVIDRTGKIRHRIIGLVDQDILKPIVIDLLSEAV